MLFDALGAERDGARGPDDGIGRVIREPHGGFEALRKRANASEMQSLEARRVRRRALHDSDGAGPSRTQKLEPRGHFLELGRVGRNDDGLAGRPNELEQSAVVHLVARDFVHEDERDDGARRRRKTACP